MRNVHLLVNCTVKDGFILNNDVNLALLQIRSMPIGAGLLTPAMLLFSRPERDVLCQMNREPININNDDAYYETLKACQNKYFKNNDTHKDTLPFPYGL